MVAVAKTMENWAQEVIRLRRSGLEEHMEVRDKIRKAMNGHSMDAVLILELSEEEKAYLRTPDAVIPKKKAND